MTMSTRRYDMDCDGKRAGAFGHCSDDQVKVWHGYETPAIACGRHMTYAKDVVFAGHRARIDHN
jgi:hypothetical protein